MFSKSQIPHGLVPHHHQQKVEGRGAVDTGVSEPSQDVSVVDTGVSSSGKVECKVEDVNKPSTVESAVQPTSQQTDITQSKQTSVNPASEAARMILTAI